MKLSPMRYKDYVWPHNPGTYSIEYSRAVQSDKMPFAYYHMQDLGLDFRVMRGQGEFAGEGAYDEFKKLASIFYHPGPGLLIHPVWQIAKAHFVKLSLAQEPTRDYVAYSFEFWEDTERYVKTGENAAAGETVTAAPAAIPAAAPAGDAKYHTVKSGETLWGISRKYGTTVDALARLNPAIKNVNLIYAGQKVRVS